MIKPLIRWSMTLGVAGAAFLSWGAIVNLIAIALPEAQVEEKLHSVPVFTIADEQGVPLVGTIKDETKVEEVFITDVFISHDDANKFVDELKIKNPELAEKTRIVTTTLGRVYKLVKSAEGEENALNFNLVPEEEALASARTIGEENKQPYQGGVPLFVAIDGEEKGMLSVELNSQNVIPFFFDKKQLEEIVTRYKEQEPEKAASIDIQVHPLDAVVKNLETSSDEGLEKIVLVPSRESIQFIQNAQAPAPTPGSEEAAPEATPEE